MVLAEISGSWILFFDSQSSSRFVQEETSIEVSLLPVRSSVLSAVQPEKSTALIKQSVATTLLSEVQPERSSAPDTFQPRSEKVICLSLPALVHVQEPQVEGSSAS